MRIGTEATDRHLSSARVVDPQIPQAHAATGTGEPLRRRPGIVQTSARRPGRWPGAFGSYRFELLALALCLFGNPGTLTAALQFQAKTVDLGTIRAGVPIRHDFMFRNMGDRPVHILEIRAGCGCLVPQLKKRIFAPGESGKIPLEIHTLGESAGPHRWYLHLAYRDGRRTEAVALQVRARVIAEVTVRPKELKIRGTAPHRQTVTLIDTRARPLRIRGLRPSDASWTVRYLGTERDAFGQWRLTFEFAVPGGSTEGEETGWIWIDTDDPVYRTLRLPVSLRRQSPTRVVATPRRLRFSRRPGSDLRKSIVLACPTRSEVMIESVAVSHQAIRVEVPTRVAGVVKVTVSVAPNRLPPGPIAGEVRFSVARPTRQMVVVPVLVDSLEPAAANLPIANDVELERSKSR